MKILLIGASGVLGKAVHAALQDRHEVVTASRSSGDFSVDITDPDSIGALYRAVGPVDAVACTAGHVPFRPLSELTSADFLGGARDKLLGQVELVRQGSAQLAEAGSFTLITGILAREPIVSGAVAAMANGGLEAFVAAAAIELPHRQRINAVSPTVFTESLADFGEFFRGFAPVPVQLAALAFVKSIEGAQTGQVYKVG